MAGSTIGNLFRVTTFGESHGEGLGVVVDGAPAGVELDEEYIQEVLDRRKPGNNPFATKRNEADKVHILSGVFEGVTTGTPIGMVIYNEDQHSKDYSGIMNVMRPGHADYGYKVKYGIRDYRGGGRASGRETASRVAAGAVAKKILGCLGVTVSAYTKSIGNIEIDYSRFDLAFAYEDPTVMPDREAAMAAGEFLEKCIKDSDSAGGVVECIVKGVPAGVGEPVFGKLDAELSRALMSIGAVKAVEIGDGVAVTGRYGSENNDSFFTRGDSVYKASNHAGGILGGISDGTDIIVRAHFKPTPSISKEQETINEKGENVRIKIKGRHDPIVVPRAVVVSESMVAITVLDAIMINAVSKIDKLKLTLE